MGEAMKGPKEHGNLLLERCRYFNHYHQMGSQNGGECTTPKQIVYGNFPRVYFLGERASPKTLRSIIVMLMEKHVECIPECKVCVCKQLCTSKAQPLNNPIEYIMLSLKHFLISVIKILLQEKLAGACWLLERKKGIYGVQGAIKL